MNGSSWSRWAPLSGVAFVVMYVVGILLVRTPDSNDPAQTIAAYYADSKSHRVDTIIAAYILIAAGLLFLWFLSCLRSRLRPAEGDPGTLSTLMFGAGVLFVGLLSVGALGLAAVPGSITFGDNGNIFDAGTIQAAQRTGRGASLIGGMLAAAVTIFTASILTLRTAALPKWSAWVGILAAIALP